MNLLVDTNIIVDVLRKREHDFESSRLLLALGKIHEFELWISPSQLSDLFYILTAGGKKALAGPVVREMHGVLQLARICTFGDEDARAALESDFDDLEDALIHQAALSVHADAIITRNQSDFSRSSIPAMSSGEFFEWLAAKKGVRYADLEIDHSSER